MARNFLLAGAIGGFLAVGLGAFGAHALQGLLSERYQDIWKTATDYQFYHSLALVLVAVLSFQFPDQAKLRWAGRFFLIGMAIFSGSLYLLTTTGIGWLGAITPIGGVSLMVGWLLLILFAVSARQS